MTFKIAKHQLMFRADATASSAHLKLAPNQPKFTTKLDTNHDFANLLEQIEKNRDDTMALMMYEMTHQLPMDGEKGQSNLSSTIAQFQSTEAMGIQAKVLAKTLEGLDESAKLQQASSMVGKIGHVDNSKKMFSGDNVTYNFDILGKDLPKDATIHGVVIIKDEKGEEIFRRRLEKPLSGENSFIWSGVDKKGKQVEHGNYKIEVDAYYTMPGSDRQIPIGVSIDTEGLITKVDIKTGDYYVNGKKIDKANLTGVSSPKEGAQKEKDNTKTDPTKYLGQTVSISNDEVEFKGESSTIVPFFSQEKAKDATVQVRFFQNDKFISMAQGKMDLTEGENKFKWNGKKTTDIDEIQALIDRKTTFGSVPQGSYRYEVWVSTEDEPRSRKLDSTITAKIDGLEYDKHDGETYAISGNERYNVKSISGMRETPAKPSLEKLQKDAADLKGKKVKIADDIVKYQGKPTKIDFSLIPGRLGADKKVGKITTAITDTKGTILRTITMESADSQAEINKYKMHYTLLDQKSKGKIDWEIGQREWVDGSNNKLFNYDLAIPTHKTEIEQIIKDYNKDELKLRPDVIVPVPQTWDGKDDTGTHVAKGQYKFTMQWEILGPNNNVETVKEPSDTVLPIADTYIENGHTMLGFENGKTVRLEDVLGWV